VFGKPKAPAYDPAEGHPLVHKGLGALEARDWPSLVAFYEGQAPSDRCHFVRGLGELSKLDDDIPLEFDDPRMLTIAAGLRVHWAWRHRGGGGGDTVTGDGGRNMMQRLSEAEEMLQIAGERTPDDSTTIGLHIRAEMGLGGDHANLLSLLTRAGRSPEANIFVATGHLMFVSPKWHGSVDEMWSAANGYASRPSGAAWVALAAYAHMEEYLYWVAFSDDKASREAYLAKLRDPSFRSFAGEMDALFWKTAEEKPMTGSEAVFAHNAFGAFLVLLNAIDLARRHLERMGPCFTRIPWYYAQYKDNPLEWLNDVRKRAGLPPLRA
jgi:hypothetical protein